MTREWPGRRRAGASIVSDNDKDRNSSGWAAIGQGICYLLFFTGLAVLFNFNSLLAVIAKFAH